MIRDTICLPMNKKTKRKSPILDDFETVAELRLALRYFQAATDRITSAHALTTRQYDLLAVLHAPSHRGALASEMADLLHISRNAMSELVSRAEHAGLVTRNEDPNDARRKPLAPTREGTNRYRAAVKDLQPEREELISILRRATKNAA
jgi:DNA-binding MarR family transcriptional regulator